MSYIAFVGSEGVSLDTVRYYDEYPEVFTAETIDADMSAILGRFTKMLPPRAYVLDWGCGTGRDSLSMMKMGFDVLATDASGIMCDQAASLGVDVRQESFDELDADSEFEGIWACASLLHLKREELPDVFSQARRALKQDGVFYCSFKQGDFEGMRGNRWFTDLDESALKELLDPGFDIVEMWTSEDVRPDRKGELWLNCLAIKRF